LLGPVGFLFCFFVFNDGGVENWEGRQVSLCGPGHLLREGSASASLELGLQE
jgi:hypothetical protein